MSASHWGGAKLEICNAIKMIQDITYFCFQTTIMFFPFSDIVWRAFKRISFINNAVLVYAKDMTIRNHTVK